jgi:hypothetical protein
MPETPTRQYRMPDREYNQLVSKATRKGMTVSYATRAAILEWLDDEQEYCLYHKGSDTPETVTLSSREALDRILQGWDLRPVMRGKDS